MEKRNWDLFFRKLTLIFSCSAAFILLLYGLAMGGTILSRGAYVLKGPPVSTAMGVGIEKIRQEKGNPIARVKRIDLITEEEKRKINEFLSTGILSEGNIETFWDRFLRAPNRENALWQAMDGSFRAEVARNWRVIVELLCFALLSAAIGFFATWAVYYILRGLYQWLWKSTEIEK